jgi:hypothetical protein
MYSENHKCTSNKQELYNVETEVKSKNLTEKFCTNIYYFLFILVQSIHLQPSIHVNVGLCTDYKIAKKRTMSVARNGHSSKLAIVSGT